MRKSIKVIHKKRGRPAAGRDPVTAIRLPAELRAAVDEWAAKQVGEVGRSEAIRRLVEIGLSRATPSERLKASQAAASAGAKSKE